ncbi:MAG: hypothetical protein K0S25_1121 [Bacillus sp. (in: firmicutes)]|nr:hypothetical protein [Bacillus sp. (in: firmicutes)]
MEFFLLGFSFGDWGLYLVGFILWGLIIASGILLTWGFWKNSWKAFLICGCTVLVPSIIISTQPGWLRLSVLVPLIAFGLAFYMKKKQ